MDDAAYQLQGSSLVENGRAAITSAAPPRRPIVMVLGMHRSGTSLCSHILSMLGVDMADDIGVDRGNDRGHWERWEIVEFHDRILALFDRGYFGPFHDFPLPVAWWADPRVAQIRREIAAFVAKRMNGTPFGFKDPRTMRLMPVWHQIISDLKLAPKIVLCLRNPAQVARSLQARDALDPEIGEHRWLVYMIDFFRFASDHEFCVLEYERWFQEPRANIAILTALLGLEWQQSEFDLDLTLSGIIDPALRHDGVHRREAGQPLVSSFYNLAIRATHEADARTQIGRFASQFVGFEQLYKPFRRSFEDVAATAARLPGMEQAATALEVVAREREAAAAAANQRASAAEARLSEALSEIEGQRARFAELERERDEGREALERAANQQGAEERSLRAEISLLHGRLEASREAGRSAIAALRGTVERAEKVAQERCASTVAMEGEIADLRQAVARATLEAERRAANAGELQVKIASLRGMVDRAEQVVHDRDAAAEAMGDEIASLRNDIAAARQVGRAMFAALRVDPKPSLNRDGRDRWWRAGSRMLGLRYASIPPLAPNRET
jgi:hypothetical protein